MSESKSRTMLISGKLLVLGICALSTFGCAYRISPREQILDEIDNALRYGSTSVDVEEFLEERQRAQGWHFQYDEYNRGYFGFTDSAKQRGLIRVRVNFGILMDSENNAKSVFAGEEYTGP